MGDAEKYRISTERRKILDVLKAAGVPLAPKEIAERTEMRPGTSGNSYTA